MSHPHTVALRRQKVLREKDLDLQILSSRERGPFTEVSREPIFYAISLVGGNLFADFSAEEAGVAPAIPPPHRVGVIRRFSFPQPFPKERGQKGRIHL